MTDMEKVSVGEILFEKLEKNQHLDELYDNILFNYSLQLFGLAEAERKPVDIDETLYFADLLSKSNHRNAEKHKMMAQEMLALLRATEPDNSELEFYLGSVLSQTGNYRGMAMVTPNHRMSTLLDRFYVEFSKELTAIPAEPEKQFFRSQVQVYKHLNEQHFSYSGPTSMGKSFIMRMFIKKQIQDSKRLNFVILVPTKALINEVSSKIINDLKDMLKEKHYKVLTSAGAQVLEEDHSDDPYNFVFVLTPERLLYLLIDYEKVPIDYLFIDEAHKISVKDSRSTFYYKVVDMLLQREHRPHIVFASPNIPNPAEFLKLIPGIQDASSRGLATTFAPVSQIKYLVDFQTGCVDLFSSCKNRSVSVKCFERNRTFFDLIRAVGRIGQETDDKKKRPQNIVYCSGTAKAVDLAIEFAKSCPQTNDKELIALAKDIGNEVHGDYYLANIITHGVAYHIGYLPTAIRMRIENMFAEGYIHTIFCTSTLVEGVNLPADNLFITSYKNGTSKMGVVDFRNLIGRVGRIEFNLYGNVFLVRLADAKRFNPEEYVKLLKEEVPEQKLSIVTALSEEQKSQIVECLVKGDISLDGTAKPGSEDYAIIRKFANILLRDITKGRNSLVRREFAPLLSEGTESKIKTVFAKNESKPDDDINVSVDQTENLTVAIIGGLSYPSIDEETGYVDYNELIHFLERLCDIFKWETYERNSIGHVSKQGTHGKLRWYGVLLSQWVKGDGLRSIMEWGIRYKDEAARNWNRPSYIGEPKANPYIYVNHQQVMYNGSLQHRNALISSMLEDIERVVLFTISNYFLRFSNEYKRIKGVKSFDNDWFEYVEYGTTNSLSIILQRNGFSRETSTYIRNHKDFYVVGLATRRPKLRKSIAVCGNTSVENEVKDALYNVPELFVD